MPSIPRYSDPRDREIDDNQPKQIEWVFENQTFDLHIFILNYILCSAVIVGFFSTNTQKNTSVESGRTINLLSQKICSDVNSVLYC